MIASGASLTARDKGVQSWKEHRSLGSALWSRNQFTRLSLLNANLIQVRNFRLTIVSRMKRRVPYARAGGLWVSIGVLMSHSLSRKAWRILIDSRLVASRKCSFFIGAPCLRRFLTVKSSFLTIALYRFSMAWGLSGPGAGLGSLKQPERKDTECIFTDGSWD